MRSAPWDLTTRSGTTRRSSRPQARAVSQPACDPTAACRVAGVALRTSTSFSIPCARSRFAVTGPTPHKASIGRSCRKASIRSGAMTVSPSGLRQPDAIFARNLLGATPADAVSPVSSRMARFSRRATSTPRTSPQLFSLTSR